MNENSGPPSMAGHPAKWSILFAVMIGSVMGPLDGSIVNVVLPEITKDFEVDISITQWVPTIYLVAISCLILFYGRLGDMIGYKKVFIYGLAAFVVTSVICGLSPNVWMLIAFRGLQGLAAGMMMAVGFAIVTSAFPPQERGKAMGMFAVAIAAGLAAGPTLGGVITEYLNWRYIFFINVPIGIVSFVIGNRVIPAGDHKEGQKLDWAGSFTALVFLGCLTLYANRGQDWGWFSASSAPLLIASILFGIAFYWMERRSPQPMLDLSLFANQKFSFANISALISFMALFAAMWLTPFFLSIILHYGILKVGYIMAAGPVAIFFIAPVAGVLSDRISTRPLMFIGMTIAGFGLLLLSGLDESSKAFDVVWRLLIVGIGIGMFQSPNNSTVMGSVPPWHLGIASGILAAMRNVGMVLGLALVGAVFYELAPAATEKQLGQPFLPEEIDEFMDGLKWAYVTSAGLAWLSAVTSLFATGQKEQH